MIVVTDIDRIQSSYDKLHGAGSHSRMTENELRVLRLHPNLDTSDMNKLLEIARVYDVSAKRQRIMHDLEVTKQKERLLGQHNCYEIEVRLAQRKDNFIRSFNCDV